MSDLTHRIEALRQQLGKDLLLLVHHYQRSEVVCHADHVGDSLELARQASRSTAELIVFCGVHFMAETASILVSNNQKVLLPDHRAGCPMADMADAADVQQVWQVVRDSVYPRTVIPVTYVNSNVELKALVGRYGGTVCTSSNAGKAFDWARARGDVVFFVPDEMLGTNTARARGIHKVVAVSPHEPQTLLSDRLADADVVVWKGYCHVHTHFTVKDVEAARQQFPDARVIVHPECTPAVVDASDASGSTGFLVEEVRNAPPGATLIVGTEINLVQRLQTMFPDRTVQPLAYSLCPNMYRITPAKVAEVLETRDPRFEVTVPPEVAREARLALERMLTL
jgi:quinolinate synthase